MNKRGDDRGGHPRQQPQPGAAGEGRERRAREGADQYLAFEADVDDAGALRPQARETREDQRHAKPDAGAKDLDEGVEHLHARGRQIGG